MPGPLVLINAIHSKTGGGKVYLRHVLPRLARMEGISYRVLARPEQRAELEGLGCATHVVSAPDGPLGALLWDQVVLPWIALRRRAALVFTPANFGPWLLGRRSLILLRNTYEAASPGSGLFLRIYWPALREVTRLSVRCAGGGLVVSASFRDHLASGLGVDAGSLQVVHHGVDPRFRPQGPRSAAAEKGPYLLSVSDIYPHKNLLVLADAFASLAARRPGLRLLLAGRELVPLYARELRERIASLGITDRVEFLGGLPQEDLPPLYRGASAAVCVSIAETFGISQLEAMGCGTPLVTSDLPFAHEIAGEAALFVSPSDPDAVAGALSRVLDDALLAGSLRERGLRRAAAFTWDATAEAVHRAIRDRVARSA